MECLLLLLVGWIFLFMVNTIVDVAPKYEDSLPTNIFGFSGIFFIIAGVYWFFAHVLGIH